ncbi:MAG: MCE family protein [Candidatus Omnitrophica bacterium]|nr:MCE family protein [Candidatus Omnitrophota bacterium]
MNKNITNEIKVGIAVVVSLLLLLTLFYKMGNFDFTKKGYSVNVLFNFAGGISKNAPVRLLGVEVGKIEAIELQYDEETKVLVKLHIDENTELRMDAKAYVSALGLMGEKYIELNPGTGSAPLLEAGSIIIGQDPFQMESITEKSEDIMENLSKALTDIRLLTTNVDGMVTENRDEVQKILENVETTSSNLKELSEDIKKHPWKVLTKPPNWKKKM